MPTLRDVARRAGVAPITASRVLNRSGSFSEEARTRVEAAAAELGYVPNRVAQSLRSRRTRMIGLLLTDITNPFWTTIARAVEDVTSAHDYHVIVCNTDESTAKQRQYVDLLLQAQVDGLLIVPAGSAIHDILRLQQHDIPAVVLDRTVPVEIDTVRADSEAGAYHLVRHLLELGHRRIAVLGGPPDISVAADRLAGCNRALSEAGLPADTAHLFHGRFDQESGYRMAAQALAAEPRPTALFAVNNFIAIGAIRAVRDAGLRIPEDIALVGFDDLPEHLVLEPFLTVAAQPAYEMGKQAAELLFARLDKSAPEEMQEIVLPTPLIIRCSSGQPLNG